MLTFGCVSVYTTDRSSSDNEKPRRKEKKFMAITPLIVDVSLKLIKSVSNFWISGFRNIGWAPVAIEPADRHFG
jgi:hypothetical protein